MNSIELSRYCAVWSRGSSISAKIDRRVSIECSPVQGNPSESHTSLHARPLFLMCDSPSLRPRAAACDKGYSSPTARARLQRRHIRPVIPTRKDQPRQRNFDRQAYRLRNQVERLINRLKQARRIATRYEKRGENYLAMVHIGMILLWLKPFADTA